MASSSAAEMPTRSQIRAALRGRGYRTAEIGSSSGNDAELAFDIIGSAEAETKVLILHGFSARGDLWGTSVAPRLLEKNEELKPNGCQCLVFDNRGVGLSSTRSTWALGRYTTSLMARDAIELLDTVGWTERVHIIGHSMGGMIAMELALAFPERVASLALVATCAQVRQQIPLRWAEVLRMSPADLLAAALDKCVQLVQGLVGPATLALQQRMDNNMRAMHGSCVHNNPVRYNELRSKKLAQKLKFGWNGFLSMEGRIGQIAAIATHHVADGRLQQLKEHSRTHRFPVLVLAAAEDRICLSGNSWRLAALLGAKCVVWEGAGHGIHHDNLAGLVDALLAALGAAG